MALTGSGEAFRRFLRRMRKRSSDLHHRLVDGPRGHVYPVAKHEGRNRSMYGNLDHWDTVTENHEISVDMLTMENALFHHTNKYDHVTKNIPVVRRGWPFCILVNFTKEYQLESQNLRFIFETGESPSVEKGTRGSCYLATSHDGSSTGSWKATLISENSPSAIKVTIRSPPDCIISDWRILIDTIMKEESKEKTYRYVVPEPVYILFNPWCPEDSVYFPEVNLLHEYVLNESGVIFHGNRKQIGAKPWFYGQFESEILEAALFVIRKGFNNSTSALMADPIAVSRIISKITNAPDDNGILVGNWSNDYTGGKSPLSWSGSVDILCKYYRQRKPVKYGQCFVFAGVVTTICRALGLPCRSITNFASAHDSDGSVTIDTYWDTSRNENVSEISDSVWNFHCWNELWMQRSDLPPGYGGWQVLDSTPQERSQGMFQCGPTSVKAIKEGRCELPFDGPFVFAEVNADHVIWSRDNDKEDWTVLKVLKAAIGHKISTKTPDGRPVPPYLTSVEPIRQDVTLDYKYPEETDQERHAVIRASRTALRKKQVYDSAIQDVIFDDFLDRDYILIGEDFDVTIYFRNVSQWDRSVEVTLICKAVLYTGEVLQPIKNQKFRKILPPRTGNQVVMWIRYHDYRSKLSDQCCMHINVVAKVIETGQKHACQDQFRLRKPDLSLSMERNSVERGQSVSCHLMFDNPLSEPLTQCCVTLTGPRMECERRIGDIGAGKTWKEIIKFTPTKTGRQQILATFSCSQISDVQGICEIMVSD